MSKIKYLSIALVSILFVTGCGKKVTCTYSYDDYGVKMTQKVVMKVKNDKITSVEKVAEAEAVSDEVKSEWKEFLELVDDEINTDDYKGIEIKKNTDDSKYYYSLTMKADLSKVDDKAKKDFSLDEFIDAKSVDDVIKEYEEDGFKCEK